MVLLLFWISAKSPALGESGGSMEWMHKVVVGGQEVKEHANCPPSKISFHVQDEMSSILSQSFRTSAFEMYGTSD